jgi:pyruvate/2-oxoglutarate dehydrogenase complex dihydrolipoamide acyltransferase (E2) component
MSEQLGYKIEPFSSNREMVAINSTLAREKNTIHLMTEVDITGPRNLIADHRERTGERLSLTAYVVTCLGRTVAEFPTFNSFRKGKQLIVFEAATITIAFEREIDGESVPEPVSIQAVNRKTYREVNDELRATQARSGERLGKAMGTDWVRFIPLFLLRTLTRLAYRNIEVWQRFGVVGVTAVGMFGSGPMWLVPLTSSTVTAAVGSIAKRSVMVDGVLHEHEHLCLTLSFDHDIIDGAPAARFTSRFAEILSSGDELRDLME